LSGAGPSARSERRCDCGPWRVSSKAHVMRACLRTSGISGTPDRHYRTMMPHWIASAFTEKGRAMAHRRRVHPVRSLQVFLGCAEIGVCRRFRKVVPLT
jgi:hypothetical protein